LPAPAQSFFSALGMEIILGRFRYRHISRPHRFGYSWNTRMSHTPAIASAGRDSRALRQRACWRATAVFRHRGRSFPSTIARGLIDAAGIWPARALSTGGWPWKYQGAGKTAGQTQPSRHALRV